MMGRRLGRRSPTFRAVAFGLLLYLVIASLHGLAPQLWARHFASDDNGPFRVLLFTLMVVALFLAAFAQARRDASCVIFPEAFPSSRLDEANLSLRGPPNGI